MNPSITSSSIAPGIRARIGIVGPELRGIPEVLARMQAGTGVRFELCASASGQNFNGVLLIGGPAAEAERLVQSGIHCLHLPQGEALSAETAAEEVQFSNQPGVPEVLRGRAVPNDLTVARGSATVPEQMTVLASGARGPLWLTRRHAGVRQDCSMLPLPALGGERALFDCFNSRNFIQLLSVIDFVKFVAGGEKWTPPPLRACFMFDDPNLHWRSYGCIHYPGLAAHAAEHNYHVAFATVPLDFWMVHGPTAKLFRERSKYLSLLIHGNNHTAEELAQSYAPAERAALLKQALQRIERLESRSGCNVSRVMAAPHGACTEDMMADMARLGYDAASISHGSLRAHNRGRAWVANVGLRMSEVIAGLPILPRFGMSKDNRNQILLAALLHQPIIPMGHHQDVAGGLGTLAETAAFVNSLGRVDWIDTQAMARSNYFSRQQGDVLRLRAYSRRLHFSVPPGVNRVEVEVERSTADESNGESIRLNGVANARENSSAANGAIDLQVTAPAAPAPSAPDRFPLPIWALARRLLSETRDRSIGLLRKSSN